MRLPSRALRWLALCALAAALAGPLAACGKRGDPKPPGDAPQTWPRSYPTG